MAEIDPLITDFHVRAVRAGVPITRVMKQAGLRTQTWAAWKNGASPKLESIRAVERALEALEGSSPLKDTEKEDG